MLICRNPHLAIACSTIFLLTTVIVAAPAAGGLFRVDGGLAYASETRGSFIASSPDAAGISREVIYDYIAPTATLPGYHLETAAEAGITGLSSRTFGEISQSSPRTGLGNGTHIAAASSLAVGRYDDVVVSGPAGPVMTSVNMSLHGGLSVGASPSLYAFARARAEVSFYVNGNYIGGGYELKETFSGSGAVVRTTGGILDAWGDSGTFTSPAFTVSANMPITLEVQLRTLVQITGYTGVAFNSGGLSSFGDTLKFVGAAAVFNVPGGYTANSLDAGIVNNSYGIPEPSSFLLSTISLFSLLATMTMERGTWCRGVSRFSNHFWRL
jgi:hypothetical protein